MKAGLTVLLAVASASVNTHVKVETVNFDEDLLNTEKNIAETSAWKEKKDKTDEPEETKTEETEETDETKTDGPQTDETDEPEDDGEPGITVTFEVKKCEGYVLCEGELTMKSHGFTASAGTTDDLRKLHSLNLKLGTSLKGDRGRRGTAIRLNYRNWLTDDEEKERQVTEEIWHQLRTAQEGKGTGTISWEISETMLKEGDLMERTIKVIDSLK